MMSTRWLLPLLTWVHIHPVLLTCLFRNVRVLGLQHTALIRGLDALVVIQAHRTVNVGCH